jgi:hypothetical protein
VEHRRKPIKQDHTNGSSRGRHFAAASQIYNSDFAVQYFLLRRSLNK